jgi:hypothetical protein
MNQEAWLTIITALVAALGVKELWQIWKIRLEKKLEIQERNEISKDRLTALVIEDLKKKIDDLELKIDSLILENTQLREKLARMEERLLVNANKKVFNKRSTVVNSEQQTK